MPVMNRRSIPPDKATAIVILSPYLTAASYSNPEVHFLIVPAQGDTDAKARREGEAKDRMKLSCT
jgi:hypothetical protein